LLTTAKDAVNLCPEFEAVADPLKVYWLEIGIGIDRRDDLLARIGAKIGNSLSESGVITGRGSL
jgi:hypothetical protein